MQDCHEVSWLELAAKAWNCRDNAYILGQTKVGAAALTQEGKVFVGCNIEQRFRSHDVHAEVNAISTMVAGGCLNLIAILIVAERTRFTPCGACLDWIFQFGGGACLVGYQRSRDGEVVVLRADELMPYYPE